MNTMKQASLGLDQALLTIDAHSVDQKVRVYRQYNECFGCDYDNLPPEVSGIQDFILSTKHRLSLQLVNSLDGNVICQLNDLDLNDHGHYRIKVEYSLNANNTSLAGPQVASSGTNVTNQITSFYNCTMETLDKGSCILCPLAILITLLFFITISEKILGKFLANRAQAHSNSREENKLRSSIKSTQSIRQQRKEQQPDLGAAATEQQSGVQLETEAEVVAATTDPTTRVPNETIEAIFVQSSGEDNASPIETRRPSFWEKSTATVTAVVSEESSRIDSLDAFRGITIAGMIMVNYGGAGYTFLEHAAWDGITLADFVFPFFIFLMGASIAISTKSMMKRRLGFRQMFGKIIRRSLLLMALGICLNSKWLDGKSLKYLRITGVLQRFAISYLVVGLMFAVELTINKWFKAQSLYRMPILTKLLIASFELLTATNFLLLYIYLTFYFNYNPNCPIGYTGPGGATEGGKFANCTGGAAAWLDKIVLGDDHIYKDTNLFELFKSQVTHDPEGLLGNATSILLTLLGLQCGKALLSSKDHKRRLYRFFIWISILAISCVNIIIIPINKRLWSLTFVTLTGCCAFLTITLLYLIIDLYKCQQTFLLRLLISGGKNSIFLYVGHSLLSGMLPWYFNVDESSHLQLLLRLTWATFLWLLAAHYMASKKLFIRL